MLSEFILKKLQSTSYKILEDETYFGTIPGLQGVWANADNLEDCRNELREVLEEWILLKVRAGDKISGFKLNTNHLLMTHA